MSARAAAVHFRRHDRHNAGCILVGGPHHLFLDPLTQVLEQVEAINDLSGLGAPWSPPWA